MDNNGYTFSGSTVTYDFGGSSTGTSASTYNNQAVWTVPYSGNLGNLTAKGIDMKGNGKEFLVFVKGGVSPVKACESEAEALEEAAALADKNDDVYFVYRAIKRVAPVRTDLEVTDL